MQSDRSSPDCPRDWNKIGSANRTRNLTVSLYLASISFPRLSQRIPISPSGLGFFAARAFLFYLYSDSERSYDEKTRAEENSLGAGFGRKAGQACSA
ncbi:hypothetical protein A7X67_01125 [Clostridium sp. W14A]|nr:hypothetical protein A7X67_01125 [Clostridium sp. W14A]